MATITINIPVDKEQWILDGLALSYQYQTTVDNPAFDSEIPVDSQTNPLTIPNPQPKPAFIKEQIIERLKRDAMDGHMATHWGSEQAVSDGTTLT